MNYEYSACTRQPRLLILLTDELEESVKVINNIIYKIIVINYDGEHPKNRFFITVIGYNKEAKVLFSGYLREIDEHPLKIESEMLKVPDGAGGVVQVERKRPIWIEPQNCNPNIENYPQAICLAEELSQEWLASEKILAPIVIDCSNEAHVEYAVGEIEQLKEVTLRDGQTLFFGTYSTEYQNETGVMSKMPEAWKYRFENRGLDERDYINGSLSRMEIREIISAITYVGGEATILGFSD